MYSSFKISEMYLKNDYHSNGFCRRSEKLLGILQENYSSRKQYVNGKYHDFFIIFVIFHS